MKITREICDCQHPETTPDGFAAISEACPIHGPLPKTLSTAFPAYDSDSTAATQAIDPMKTENRDALKAGKI